MKFTKPQIAAAITAVVALLAAMLLLFTNISSQSGSTPSDGETNLQGSAQINPLQALPHTIAACRDAGDARYAITMGDNPAAQESFAQARSSAELAAGFDPKWQRLLDKLTEVSESETFDSLANRTANATHVLDIPLPVAAIENICESILSEDISADYATTMACVWVEHWNNTRASDPDNDLYRQILLEALTYTLFVFDENPTNNGFKSEFAETIALLQHANSAGADPDRTMLYTDISAQCASR